MKNKKLYECVESLIWIRARLHDGLSPSVRAELDLVIDRIQSCIQLDRNDEEIEKKVRQDGLAILARIIESMPLIADFIARIMS